MKVTLKTLAFVIISCSLGNAQQSFPDSWLGKYKGNLMIYGIDSVKMKVEMNLDILKTAIDSIYDWTLTYDLNGRLKAVLQKVAEQNSENTITDPVSLPI